LLQNKKYLIILIVSEIHVAKRLVYISIISSLATFNPSNDVLARFGVFEFRSKPIMLPYKGVKVLINRLVESNVFVDHYILFFLHSFQQSFLWFHTQFLHHLYLHQFLLEAVDFFTVSGQESVVFRQTPRLKIRQAVIIGIFLFSINCSKDVVQLESHWRRWFSLWHLFLHFLFEVHSYLDLTFISYMLGAHFSFIRYFNLSLLRVGV